MRASKSLTREVGMGVRPDMRDCGPLEFAISRVGRAAVESIPWLGLPAAVLELEAPLTTGKFSSAAHLTGATTVTPDTLWVHDRGE